MRSLARRIFHRERAFALIVVLALLGDPLPVDNQLAVLDGDHVSGQADDPFHPVLIRSRPAEDDAVRRKPAERQAILETGARWRSS